jgi:hypothetical protein
MPEQIIGSFIKENSKPEIKPKIWFSDFMMQTKNMRPLL